VNAGRIKWMTATKAAQLPGKKAVRQIIPAAGKFDQRIDHPMGRRPSQRKDVTQANPRRKGAGDPRTAAIRQGYRSRAAYRGWRPEDRHRQGDDQPMVLVQR
jgi:hypothetical protein